MATVTVRRVDDGAYAQLKARAKTNGRSVEAEVRRMIEEPKRDIDAIVADLRAFHAEMAAKHGYGPDSVSLIRAVRDEE